MNKWLSEYQVEVYGTALERTIAKVRKGDNSERTAINVAWLVKRLTEALHFSNIRSRKGL